MKHNRISELDKVEAKIALRLVEVAARIDYQMRYGDYMLDETCIAVDALETEQRVLQWVLSSIAAAKIEVAKFGECLPVTERMELGL